MPESAQGSPIAFWPVEGGSGLRRRHLGQTVDDLEVRGRFCVVTEAQQEQPGRDPLDERPLLDRLGIDTASRCHVLAAIERHLGRVPCEQLLVPGSQDDAEIMRRLGDESLRIGEPES